jgi:hypothetical protein
MLKELLHLLESAGKVYDVEVRVKHTLDMRKPEHRAAYEEARIAYNASHSDPDDKLPKITSEGFIHRGDGLPMWGYVSQIKDAMPEFDSMLVSEGGHPSSLAVFNGSNVKVADHKTGWYHGSPNTSLKAFRGVTFVTRHREEAQRYASGSVVFAGKLREATDDEWKDVKRVEKSLPKGVRKFTYSINGEEIGQGRLLGDEILLIAVNSKFESKGYGTRILHDLIHLGGTHGTAVHPNSEKMFTRVGWRRSSTGEYFRP